MLELLNQLAAGKREVLLMKCSYGSTWTCSVEQRASLNGDQTNVKIAVEHENPAEAVRGASVKFFQAVGIFPELQPAIEHRASADEAF